MDDKQLCKACEQQYDEDFPHAHLTVISRIPDSTIYICSSCHSFWICTVETGWDLLDSNGLIQTIEEPQADELKLKVS